MELGREENPISKLRTWLIRRLVLPVSRSRKSLLVVLIRPIVLLSNSVLKKSTHIGDSHGNHAVFHLTNQSHTLRSFHISRHTSRQSDPQNFDRTNIRILTAYTCLRLLKLWGRLHHRLQWQCDSDIHTAYLSRSTNHRQSHSPCDCEMSTKTILWSEFCGLRYPQGFGTRVLYLGFDSVLYLEADSRTEEKED